MATNLLKCSAAKALESYGFMLRPINFYEQGVYAGKGFDVVLKCKGIRTVFSYNGLPVLCTVEPGKYKTREILGEILPKICRLFREEWGDLNNCKKFIEGAKQWGPVLILEAGRTYAENEARFVINPFDDDAVGEIATDFEKWGTSAATMHSLLDRARLIGNGWDCTEDKENIYLKNTNNAGFRVYKISKNMFSFFLSNGFCYMTRL
jgi:hypothetical protein